MALYINAVCFLISIAVTLLISRRTPHCGGKAFAAPPLRFPMACPCVISLPAAFIVRTPLVRAIVIMVVLTNLSGLCRRAAVWPRRCSPWSVSCQRPRVHDVIDTHVIPAAGALTAAVTAGMPFGSVLAGYLGQSMTLPMAFAIIGGCYAGVFALTGFGRHWRKFNESFRHATEV